MKNAIEKAIEGGYNTDGREVYDYEYNHYLEEKIFLDPLFWQSLGKAEGWKCRHCGGTGIARNRDVCFGCGGKGVSKKEWLEPWHRFIDHLAEGKKPEDFFTSLLTIKE